MRKFDLKSLAAGFIIGTLGLTTVFGAAGIQSAALSNTKVTLNGALLSLGQPLISVKMDDGQDASLYAPVNEVLEKLGYAVNYDEASNTIDIITEHSKEQEAAGQAAPQGNVVIDLANHPGQRNIAESGSFQAEDGQRLTLEITSDIEGGSVDLFLFDPTGIEQRITIESVNMRKTIVLSKGEWKYNCSGIFKEGGNVRIVGMIQ